VLDTESVQRVESGVNVVGVTSQSADSRQQHEQTDDDRVQLSRTAVSTSVPIERTIGHWSYSYDRTGDLGSSS